MYIYRDTALDHEEMQRRERLAVVKKLTGGERWHMLIYVYMYVYVRICTTCINIRHLAIVWQCFTYLINLSFLC